MAKLKGKGGLAKCPVCKSDNISARAEKQWIGCDEMAQQVDCLKCGKTFWETWKCIDWEEMD